MEGLSPENKERRFSGVKFYKGRLLIEATVKVNREMNSKIRIKEQGVRSQKKGQRKKQNTEYSRQQLQERNER
jgi:hypothetical protein